MQLYLPKLTPQGSIEFIGCGLGRDGRATFIDEMSEVLKPHNAAGHALLLGKSDLKRGDFGYDSTVVTAAITSNISAEVCYNVYDLHFKQLGANEMYYFFMRVHQNGSTNGTARIGITDLSHNNCNWFV